MKENFEEPNFNFIGIAIEEQLKKNKKYIEDTVYGLTSIKEIVSKYNKFKFEVSFEYKFAGKTNKNNEITTNTMITKYKILYTITLDKHTFDFSFTLSEVAYLDKQLEISRELVKFADCYIQNKKYVANAGNEDFGDVFVNIKDYLLNIYLNFDVESEIEFSQAEVVTKFDKEYFEKLEERRKKWEEEQKEKEKFIEKLLDFHAFHNLKTITNYTVID